MKKQLLFIAALSVSALANAQAVPNGGFETWNNQTLYEDPAEWGTLNILTLLGAPASVTKSTSAHSGTYAAKVESVAADLDGDGNNDTLPGSMFVGSIDFMSETTVNGAPFTSRPDSLTGWYKYAPVQNDFFAVVVTLTKWNAGTSTSEVIATGEFLGMSAAASYTRFATQLDYISSDTPDSMQLIVSSSGNTPTPGTALWVDDFAFVTNSAVALPEPGNVSVLQYFPNPANQSLTVIAPKTTTIGIYNALGMRVETVKAKAGEKTTIATDAYRNGVYFLKLENGDTERFVVQH